MYTQCPHCGTSFRVTAEVLKQAAGNVRCGGCGNAFNALEHLSEAKPEPRPAAPVPGGSAPELTPDQDPADVQPRASISPEQSAALLKTLDELAGSDVHLEDTGIEWRVLDEEDGANGTPVDAELSAGPGSPPVDDIFSSTATPIDEVLVTGDGTAVESPEVFDAAASSTVPDEVLRFDDNTGLPEDYDDSADAGREAAPPVPEPVRDAPEPMSNLQVDLGVGDEWEDLLDEVGPEDGAATGAGDSEPTLADELEALDVEIADDEAAPDGDELASRMEALSLELSGIQEELDMLSVESGEPTLADELEALVIEPEDDDIDFDAVAEAAAEDVEAAREDESEEPAEDEIVLEDIEDAAEEETDAGDERDVAEAELDGNEEPEDSEETSIDEDLIAAAFESERATPVGEHAEEHVPPSTEDEDTANRLIDEELMALAIEDEDGFASTMVIDDEARDESESGQQTGPAEIPTLPPDAEVEEIVMEGAVARSGTDLEEQEAEEAALKEEAAALIAAATAEEEEEKPPFNWRLVAGIAALALLLALQAVHFSRDALSRVPAINDILAPIYESVGMPLTPAWDVTGWRFEATRGSTDETGAVLSIYSRIGNRSESALPYPVISVSLTDRFEETIGSRVFDSSEYLTDDLDTRRMVEPGTSFNALMSIESPAAEATGFKLNVCYRLADQSLRCAIEDFK